MAFQPVGYRLKVKPDEVEEKTAGGIIIPDQVKDRDRQATTTGLIVAVGSEAWEDVGKGRRWAKSGDRCMFPRYAGSVHKDEDGTEYRFLNDQDIIAIEES